MEVENVISCSLPLAPCPLFIADALNKHGSCREQGRRKAGASTVQTGNETALNELVPIRKISCAYRQNHRALRTMDRES